MNVHSLVSKALVVKGSILDVAQGDDETMALLGARLLLVCDRSGSMRDYEDGKTRSEIEDGVVTSLQGKHPGQIALVWFHSTAALALDGHLPDPQGGTNMTYALNLIAPVVALGVRACIISDGYPDDPEECIHIAQQMHGYLDCIFIGKKGSDGDKFMKRLAAAVGGTYEVNEATKELERLVEKLLLKSGH